MVAVVAVEDASESETAFFEVPARLYAGTPWYRPDQVARVRWTFDPASNPAFEGGAARRWVALRDGLAVGRIAAFHRVDRELGGLGFANLADDMEVANALFDSAEAWLRERGASGWEGPTHFGERDRFCGLAVGELYPTLPLENQHGPWEEALWRARGERVYELITFRVDFAKVDLARLDAVTRMRGSAPLEVATYAAEDCADAVLAVYAAAFDPGKRLRALRTTDPRDALLDTFAGSRVALATVEGRPAGFLAWLEDPELGPKGWGFAVDPGLRVRGVSAAVTAEAIRSQQANGWPSCAIAGIASYSTAVVSYMEKTIAATRERIHATYRHGFGS